MSDDVTIPRETAADIAKALRNVAESWKPLGRSLAVERLTEWADLLDPPQSSLRDEVVSELGDTSWAGETADRVLAVVQRHVEALPAPTGDRVSSWLHWRDDVLRLLGGAE